MAAGRGTRISRYIGDMPKCTLDIGGTSLIRHTAEMLLANGVSVSVVLGYKKGAVIEALSGLPVTYFHNPFFDVTNSIASLWFAREVLGKDDLIVANADVYWDEDMLEALVTSSRDPVMLADSSRGEEGDYLFKYEDERLLKYGKDLNGADVSGEYVGIAKIGRDYHNIFLGRLHSLVDSQNHTLWWEDVLYTLIHDEGRVVYVKDISGQFWSEIDFIEDYQRITDHRRQREPSARSLLAVATSWKTGDGRGARVTDASNIAYPPTRTVR